MVMISVDLGVCVMYTNCPYFRHNVLLLGRCIASRERAQAKPGVCQIFLGSERCLFLGGPRIEGESVAIAVAVRCHRKRE